MQRQRENQQEPGDDAGQSNKRSRREGMKSIARRRAAHFAHFTADDEAAQDGDNVHVGGDQASTLGPWSSAVELVNARGKAAADRSNKILHARRQSDAGDAAVDWVPSRDISQGLRSAPAVASLFDTCVGLLCEYIDCVESLWGVPDAIKVKIAKAASAKRKLSPEVARLFVEGGPSEVVLDSCDQLEQAVMVKLLQEGLTSRLERLELNACGRGLGDDAALSAVRVGRLQSLETLKVGGAYRLSDEGAEALVGLSTSLTTLSLSECPKLTCSWVEWLPTLTPHLRRLELPHCRGLDVDSLVAAVPQLTALQALNLEGMEQVDDSVIMELANMSSLQDLNLKMCTNVGDDGIVSLCARLPALHRLLLDDCRITDRSLQAIAGALKELQVFSVRHCSRLSDAGLRTVADLGTIQDCNLNSLSHVGASTIMALARHCSTTLECLDISFCRGAPESAVGCLVDRCQRLKTLKVFGCSQLTMKFYAGHINDGLEILGMGTMQK